MRKNVFALLVSSALGLAAFDSPAAVFLSDSFPYASGLITTNAATNVTAGKWAVFSGVKSDSAVAGGQLAVSQANTDDVQALLLGGPFEPAKTNITLYAAFKVTFTTLPATHGYFAHFKDGGTAFKARVYATNSAGALRLGIANGAGIANKVSGDLTLNVPHKVVIRYNLNTANAQSAMGVDPASEADLTLAATDTATVSTATAFAFRQATGLGVMTIDDVIVAASYAEAAGALPGETPFFTVQPTNTSVADGSTVAFTVAAGGPGVSYQWLRNGSAVGNDARFSGATTPVLTLTGAGISDSNTTFVCVISNAAAWGASTAAILQVAPPAPPTVVSGPTNTTVVVGNTATLAVVVSGSPPLSYQWFFNEAPLSGANSASLVQNNVQFSQAGSYQVIVTNPLGSATSGVAVLTVNAPPTVATNIAYLHSLQDANWALTNTTTYFTIEGIVSTWANLTGSTGVNTNSLFYVQDATGGIAVFWRGNANDLPPAGARVRVTGKLEQYNGLTELVPQTALPWTGVQVLSTDNPMPAPQAFDYAWPANPAAAEAAESSLITVTDVVFDSAFTTFDSVSAGITFTNPSGQTFVLYVNKYTDVVGQKIPLGPCTITGVLGQFDSTSPYSAGYQLIPSRYADIVSLWKAPQVRFTNYLSRLVRAGEPLVSAYPDYGLLPGERLHAEIVIGDGTSVVNMEPLTAGMPANVTWLTGAGSGTRLRASFDFEATAALAGTLTAVTLRTSNDRITSDIVWNLYVPTAAEQQITISEILPNPATNASQPHFNPLRRPAPQENAYANDEFVEIANLSASEFDLYNWTLADAVKVRHTFWNGSYGYPPEVLPAKGSVIIYGGTKDFTNSPALATACFVADTGTLALNDSGGETLTLRNQDSNVISRVYYAAGAPQGSLTRFPNLAGSFQPQAAVWTNYSSPGAQFNGATFAQASPSLTNVVPAALRDPSRNVAASWPGVAGRHYTVWQANEAAGPYTAFRSVPGAAPTTGATLTNDAPRRFYRVTTP